MKMKLFVPVLWSLGFLLSFVSHAQVDERKKLALDAVERNAIQIALVGDSLYYFAELGMQEFESAKFLKETLEGIGFRVETGGAGFPTNVWAEWGSGNPKIVIVTEWMRCPRARRRRAASRANPWCQGHRAIWRGTTRTARWRSARPTP